jgi:hypothetical protein
VDGHDRRRPLRGRLHAEAESTPAPAGGTMRDVHEPGRPLLAGASPCRIRDRCVCGLVAVQVIGAVIGTVPLAGCVGEREPQVGVERSLRRDRLHSRRDRPAATARVCTRPGRASGKAPVRRGKGAGAARGSPEDDLARAATLRVLRRRCWQRAASARRRGLP